jgi:hypothetical protein
LQGTCEWIPAQQRCETAGCQKSHAWHGSYKLRQFPVSRIV